MHDDDPVKTAFLAIQKDDVAALAALLADGLNPNADDGRDGKAGFTLLNRAVLYSRVEIVKALLRAGADPGLGHSWGWTPLTSADSRGIATLLLDAGADPNASISEAWGCPSEHGQTALHVAISCRRPEVLRVLIAHGADPNRRDDSGRTPLLLAALEENSVIGWPFPLPEAIGNELSRLLRDAGARVGLAEAAALGELETVTDLLEAGLDLHTDLLNDALYWAAGCGQVDAIRLLQCHGADVNATGGRDGATALGHAAYEAQSGAVRHLLESGAEPNRADRCGKTPLLASVSTPKSIALGIKEDPDRSARLLLEHGADPTLASTDGWTPLLAAVMNEREVLVGRLLSAGADPNVFATLDNSEDSRRGVSPLLLASVHQNATLIAALLNAGADPNAANWKGKTPLGTARAAEERPERPGARDKVIALLLAAGAHEEG